MAAIAACLPLAAHANSGIGFFIPASMMLVVALLPVIPLEGLILGWRLRVPLRRAMWISFCANLVSTFVGAAIGIALDLAIGGLTGSLGAGGREGLVVSLVLMFGITVWLENRTARQMQPDAAPRILGGVVAANLVSYALLVAAAIFFVDSDPGLDRSRVTEVINVMGVEKTGQAEALMSTGRFRPVTRTQPGNWSAFGRWPRISTVSPGNTVT